MCVWASELFSKEDCASLLMQARGQEFVFEAADSLLAWRCWPSAGTSAWQAAAKRHGSAAVGCGCS